ncbi:MAG: lysylphosphatidylglycerol synthase transmembrane domain-containing protein [Candidatus Promineifilaceae bacterium]
MINGRLSPPVRLTWLRLALGLALALAGIYVLALSFDWETVPAALAQANATLITAALASVVLVIIAKAGRWRLFFAASAPLSLAHLLRALAIGMLANLLLPLRLGEVARVYALQQQTGLRKTTALSTLVAEKTLDLLVLVFASLALLPAFLLPQDLLGNALGLIGLTAALLAGLILLARHADRVSGWLAPWFGRLPTRLGRRLEQLVLAGLDGLQTLRQARRLAALILASMGILVLSVLTPWFLFKAFGLPFGLGEALALNLAVTIGSAPPSTPGKLVVFEALTLLALGYFGLDKPAMGLSYALTFHLVAILPPILLGSAAAARLHFRLPLALKQIG